jgi:hypothetical protein
MSLTDIIIMLILGLISGSLADILLENSIKIRKPDKLFLPVYAGRNIFVLSFNRLNYGCCFLDKGRTRMTTIFIIVTVLLFFIASFYMNKLSARTQVTLGAGFLLYFFSYALLEPMYRLDSLMFALFAISLINKNLRALFDLPDQKPKNFSR